MGLKTRAASTDSRTVGRNVIAEFNSEKSAAREYNSPGES
jgi:hypothetical protein